MKESVFVRERITDRILDLVLPSPTVTSTFPPFPPSLLDVLSSHDTFRSIFFRRVKMTLPVVFSKHLLFLEVAALSLQSA